MHVRFWAADGIDTGDLYEKACYYMEPEYGREADTGEYTVRIYSSTNRGTYSLAIGTIEKFTVFSLIQAMLQAKSLDSWFFSEGIGHFAARVKRVLHSFIITA